MLPLTINDAEKLYRAVPKKPHMWKSQEDRPSSALFKDSKGVSVDRDGGRSIDDICQAFERRIEMKALVCLSAGECRKLQTYPVAKAERDNPFHAEIHDSQNRVQLPSKKARDLAKAFKIVRKF